MFFIYNSQTYLLVGISIERLVNSNILLNKFKFQNMFNFRNVVMFSNKIKLRSVKLKLLLFLIVFGLVLSTLLSILPLIGESKYSLEGLKITCGIEWQNHPIKSQIYNSIVAALSFIVPTMILISMNLKLLQNVRFHLVILFFCLTILMFLIKYKLKSYRIFNQNENCFEIKLMHKRQNQITKSSILLVGRYLLRWWNWLMLQVKLRYFT